MSQNAASGAKRRREEDAAALPSWYSPNTLSILELESMADFFVGDDDSTEEASRRQSRYIALRTAMVSMYEQEKEKYLSATCCRQKINGDASLILRVHAVLNELGLINYRATNLPNHTAASCDAIARVALPLLTAHIAKSEDGGRGEGQGGRHATHADWDAASDETLRDLVSQTSTNVKSSSSSRSKGSGKGVKVEGNHTGLDWEAIAKKVGHPISHCIARYASFSLSLPLQTKNAIIEDVSEATHLATLGLRQAATSLTEERATALVNAIVEEGGDTMTGDVLHNVASTAMALAAVSAAAKVTILQKQDRLRQLLNEYMDTRYNALRASEKLLHEIEDSQYAENLQQASARQDVSITRLCASSNPAGGQ